MDFTVCILQYRDRRSSSAFKSEESNDYFAGSDIVKSKSLIGLQYMAAKLDDITHWLTFLPKFPRSKLTLTANLWCVNYGSFKIYIHQNPGARVNWKPWTMVVKYFWHVERMQQWPVEVCTKSALELSSVFSYGTYNKYNTDIIFKSKSSPSRFFLVTCKKQQHYFITYLLKLAFNLISLSFSFLLFAFFILSLTILSTWNENIINVITLFHKTNEQHCNYPVGVLQCINTQYDQFHTGQPCCTMYLITFILILVNKCLAVLHV